MKKYIIFTMFLFIPFLVNAEENLIIDYGDYNSYVLVEEVSLPSASNSTLNKIYKVDNKYYITNVISGGQLYVLNNTIESYLYIYGYDYNAIYNYLNNTECKSTTNYITNPITYNDDCIILYKSTSDKSKGIHYYINTATNKVNVSYKNYSGSTSFITLKEDNSLVFIERTDNYRPYIDNITYINVNSLLYNKIYKNTPSSSYSWLEIFPTYKVDYSYIDKDFYLFFTFDDIKKFDILENYDLYSFNDFQKLVIVLGFNIFYLGFIGFIVYIFLKLFYKLISFLKQFS